jgi:hypothetical protein
MIQIQYPSQPRENGTTEMLSADALCLLFDVWMTMIAQNRHGNAESVIVLSKDPVQKRSLAQKETPLYKSGKFFVVLKSILSYPALSAP